MFLEAFYQLSASPGSKLSIDNCTNNVMLLDGVTRRPRDNRSYNSRRSSTDSSEDGFNQNVRDLKQELKDMEEKFRKAMVANASLDNEKSQLMFQVNTRFQLIVAEAHDINGSG